MGLSWSNSGLLVVVLDSPVYFEAAGRDFLAGAAPAKPVSTHFSVLFDFLSLASAFGPGLHLVGSLGYTLENFLATTRYDKCFAHTSTSVYLKDY